MSEDFQPDMSEDLQPDISLDLQQDTSVDLIAVAGEEGEDEDLLAE
jgi:hypothetical protein